MRRSARFALALLGTFAAAAVPAVARWHLATSRSSSLAYNQGVAFDPVHRVFFFDGASSLTNSGLFRTNSRLVQRAANQAVLPRTAEGYNHTGDLSYDSPRRRILLPLECYYPASGGNTCGVGAIGVADPVTLRFRYYVNLARRQIKKAMWDEIDPEGRWIWTSSGTHLLAYPAAQVSAGTARRQRAGRGGGIVGVDLGPVLPNSGVTGATFYADPRTRALRLLLSLNLGTSFRVISFGIAGTRRGPPRLLSARPGTIITLLRSYLNDEPEGLVATARSGGRYPLGGPLSWQLLPTISSSTVFSRILTYAP